VLFFTISRATTGGRRDGFCWPASFAFYAWWSFEYWPADRRHHRRQISRSVVGLQELAERRGGAAKVLVDGRGWRQPDTAGLFQVPRFFRRERQRPHRLKLGARARRAAAGDIPSIRSSRLPTLVDSWRRKVEQLSFGTYALFVLFFPQLIAGPIVHHWQLLPQLEDGPHLPLQLRSVCRWAFPSSSSVSPRSS